MPFWIAFDDTETAYSVVLEDDDRVAYAYLWDRRAEAAGEKPIVGDVWLYNVAPAPGEPPWQADVTEPELPFLNAMRFIDQSELVRLEQAAEVTARWFTQDGERWVEVIVDGVPYGRLAPGLEPGESRFAREASPVASPLATR